MENRNFLSPSKIKAAMVYVLLLLIVSPVIGGLIGMIAASNRGIDGGLVFASFFQTSTDKDVLLCHTIGLGYAHFICNLLCLLGVGFYLRNYLIEDVNKIKSRKKFYLILIPTLALAFTGISYLIDLLFTNLAGSSNNQNTIVEIMGTSARIPMIISTVLLAPVIEELIFRKAIFEALRKYSIVPCYVASILCFALPHMLSGSVSFGVWMLQLMPYVILGGMLCFVYHVTNHNVYASICAHMLNNLLAVIMVFI